MTVVISRREHKKAAARSRILSTAIDLFSRKGIDAVTVDEIAAAADVGKGTIYNYFSTKEDIIVAFMADLESRVQLRLRSFIAGTASLDSILARFIEFQFRLKAPYHQFVRVFLGQIVRRTEQFIPYMVEMQEVIERLSARLFAAREATAEKRFAGSEAMMSNSHHRFDRQARFCPGAEPAVLAAIGLKTGPGGRSKKVQDAQGLDPTSIERAPSDDFSLDPNRNPLMPDLAHVDPKLIGPITDFMTFYVDLWRAEKLGELKKTGDQLYFKQGTRSRGRRSVVSSASLHRLRLHVEECRRSQPEATLEMPSRSAREVAGHAHRRLDAHPRSRHSEQLVGVNRTQDGKFHAAVGKETFDVEIKVSLVDCKATPAHSTTSSRPPNADALTRPSPNAATRNPCHQQANRHVLEH